MVRGFFWLLIWPALSPPSAILADLLQRSWEDMRPPSCRLGTLLEGSSEVDSTRGLPAQPQILPILFWVGP